MAHTYNRDYSVVQIKRILAESETRLHPYNSADHGHGFSKHHAISDSAAIAANKSAFIISQSTNAYHETLDPADVAFGMNAERLAALNIRTRTISDQAFMVTAILNTPFGQAALALLNTGGLARLTIHAHPESTGMGGAMKMRTVTGGKKNKSLSSSENVAHVIMVIDNGLKDPHFVTAYPTDKATYFFKYQKKKGKAVPPPLAKPYTVPGAELEIQIGGSTLRSYHRWSRQRQGDDGALVRVF